MASGQVREASASLPRACHELAPINKTAAERARLIHGKRPIADSCGPQCLADNCPRLARRVGGRFVGGFLANLAGELAELAELGPLTGSPERRACFASSFLFRCSFVALARLPNGWPTAAHLGA